MKISVSRHHPLNSVNGKQPLPHLCRQYSTMGGSSVGFSDSPMDKQQLRRGLESDCFVKSIHPEDRSQYNISISDCKPAMGLDMDSNPTLFWKPMAKEIDKQEQQVRAGPLQAQFHDRRGSPRGQAIQVDPEMASKLFIRPSHTKVSPLDDDPEFQHSPLSSEHGIGSNSFQTVSENPTKKCVKLLCSFGGTITARPVDGRLRYVGGETHIVSVYNNVGFAEFLFKMAQFYGCPLNFKYQLPGEDLDALVSVTSDDDMQNMMEEYERAIISHGLTTSSGHTSFRLRLFFSSPNSELEVEDVKAVREDVCSSNQAFVDVINKVSRRLHSSPPENEFAGLQHVDATRNYNTNDQIPLLDQLKEGIQYSAAPSSSLTTLNFRKPSYKRPPGLVDLSIPSVHEDFSQVTIEPLKFEGNTNKESSKSSSSIACRQHYEHSNYDPRFSTPMESSKIRNTDVASFPRYVENWINIHHINSSGKLSQPHVHDDLPKTNIGGSLGHWYGTQRLPDAVSSQGEHHLLNQKYVPPFDSSQQSHLQQHLYRHHHGHHQYHHPDPHNDYQHQENQKRLFHHQHQHLRVRQEQRSLYFQNDVDIGQNDHLRQKMNMQQQVHVTQRSKFSYSGHDVYANDHRRSWGPGQHGKPCSTHSATQFVHGMIPTLPYQLEKSPSSPHVVLNDCQIKCACGLQHSQVHRGITVSIREQPYSQWTPASHEHVAHKQALHYSSRFYTNSGCGVYSSTWQQGCPSLSTQAECNEFSSHRLQMHVRYPREFQSKKCQFKITPQYDGSLSENGIDLLAQGSSKQWKHSDCRNCFKSQNQKITTAATHNVHAEVIDQSLELFLQDRDMDSDTCRVSSVTKASPGIITYTDEEENDAEEIICRVESRPSASLFSEKPDCRESLAAHTDHVQYCREFQIPPRGISGSSEVRSEVLTHSASSWHLNLSLIRDSEVQNHCSLPPSEPGHQFNMLPFEQSKINFRMDKSTNFLPKSDLAAINLHSTSNMVVEGLEHIDGCGIFPMANNENDGEAISTLFCGDDSHNVARKVRIDNIIHHCVTSDFELVDQSDDALSWYAAYGNYQISPDVISFDHETSTSMASSVTHNTVHTKTFPDIDCSESDSTQMAEFSFPDGKSSIPSSETISDKESMMATAVVPESLASSVVYHCSDEVLTLETSILVPDARCSIFHEVLDEMDNIFGKMDPEIISFDINSLNHSGTEVINSTFEIQAILDVSENVLDKSGTTGCPVENTLVNGRIEAVSSCRTLHNSCKGNVTEKYSFSAYQTKNPSLSEAEVDTAAHGLQIIKSSDLEDMKELGSGTYGTVYHGKWRGSDVAIKRLKPSCFNGPESDRERLITDFWQEACTLGQLHHPNVVAFYGVVPDDLDGNLATVTEYMVNGSLKQVLRKKDRTIDRRKRIFIAMDAAFGMEYLHSKSIVHFDLKCENLLVNMKDAQRPICKVGDFGLSKVKHHTLVSGGVRGTLPWMAPELLSGKNSMVSEKVDVFSFGIVMWELLTGEEPYANMHCGAIIGGIVNDTLRPTIPSWCDPGWRDLMERCWSANPAERPSFTEVSRELRAMAASMNMK